MQCTQLATQTSVIPLNLRLIVHLSSFGDNLWEMKKESCPQSWLWVAAWSLGESIFWRWRRIRYDRSPPLNSLAARVYPSRVAVMLMWITWPCARLQWSRALPQSLPPIRDVIIGEDAAAQHHYSELRHYLPGNIRMLPCFDPNNPNKAKLILVRWLFW